MQRSMLTFCIFTLAALMLTLAPGLADDAQAKRFGGGKSFGFSRPLSRPAPRPASPGFSQQQQNTRQQQAASRTPGGMFGRGGMGFFGGLLAGSLLGSMFFGHPFAGAGMLDLLLIGGAILLVMKLLRSRPRLEPEPPNRQQPFNYHDSWTRLRSGPPQGAPGPAREAPKVAPEASQKAAPDGFDTHEFLKGAKLVFARLQEAWDRRDLEDLRDFMSAEVFEEIERQAAEDPQPSQTTILLLEADLAHSERKGGATEATVRYRALLKENDGPAEPQETNEIWHFRRENDHAMWKLVGIAQE